MTVFIIIAIVAIIVLPIIIATVKVSTHNRKQQDLEDIWSTLDRHLANQNYNIPSRIEVMTYVGKGAKRILNVAISIDTQNKRFVFTKLSENQDQLVSEILSFDKIIGGELLIGGKSSTSNSFGSAVGMNTKIGAINGTAWGSSMTSTETYVHSIEYKIKTSDMLNPLYTVVISNMPINETGERYKHYMDVAVRLDTMIQQIVAER